VQRTQQLGCFRLRKRSRPLQGQQGIIQQMDLLARLIPVLADQIG
jgi:hypothetical protein